MTHVTVEPCVRPTPHGIGRTRRHSNSWPPSIASLASRSLRSPSTPAARGREIAYLELRSTDLPEGVCVANLYARIELPLATIFETPVQELTALLKRRLIALTAIVRSAEMPPLTTLMAN